MAVTSGAIDFWHRFDPTTNPGKTQASISSRTGVTSKYNGDATWQVIPDDGLSNYVIPVCLDKDALRPGVGRRVLLNVVRSIYSIEYAPMWAITQLL